MNPYLLPPLSFFISYVILTAILRSPLRMLALDFPNERSLHSKPISRLGGVAIVGGVSAPLLWQSNFPLLSALLVLSLLSLIDDLRGLKVWVRLVIQALVIGSYYWMSFSDAMPFMALVVLGASAIWLTNLYNFMDGIDGLAGGMAVAGFATYAVGFFIADQIAWSIVALSISSASAAFLWFNFHPAKIYMGDAGSIPLGFMAAALGTIGWVTDVWPIWFPFVVFSAFITDATVTLIRRYARGEEIWLPHREHFYQKLTLLGLGHKRTALLEYAIIVISCIFALVGLNLTVQGQWLLSAIGLVLYGALFMKIESRWLRPQND